MRPASLLALVLAIAFATQGAAASWSVHGDKEPNTPRDVSGGRMWLEPDTEPTGMRVYFDAFYVEGATEVNPNVATLGSRVIAPGPLSFGAYFGVWKDCNADGYVGHAESALADYHAGLLTPTPICPPGSMWNTGTTVTEFAHFAPGPGTTPRKIFDLEARIWGDFGLADVEPIPDVDCNLNAPLPRGTLDSTGGILLLVDCQTDYNIARTITEADALLGLGIGFDGPNGHHRPDQDCDNPLNVQLDLYGDSPCNPDDPGLLEAGTRHRMVDVWDCAARDRGQKIVDVRDPTARPGERGELSEVRDPQTGEVVLNITDRDGTYGVPFPRVFTIEGGGLYLEFGGLTPIAPNVNDTDGSAEDTRAHLNDGAQSCANVEGRDGIGEPITNGDMEFDPLRGKRRADFTFTYRPPRASGTCHLGVCATRADAPWIARESYGPPTGFPNGVVRRDNLQPVGSTWATFYAFVGSASTSRGVVMPNSGVQSYGSEPCGAFLSGVHGGWDCDATHWWNADFGEDDMASGPRPGTRYQMRDVDCLDGSLGGGTGILVSLATLSSDPSCPTVDG